MYDTGPAVAVEAIFDDCVAAEIACALLSEASLRPEEPEAVGLRSWLVRVRGLTPGHARRAQVVLQRARAGETRIVAEGVRVEQCRLAPAALGVSADLLAQP